MVKDAELHAEEDKKRKDLIQERNMTQEVINGADKMLSEHGDKIAEDVKNEITARMEDAKKVLESEDVDALKQASESLTSAMSKAGEAIHRAAQAQQQQQQSSEGNQQPEKDDNVVDADYKVKE
jgi:molecular chaperone DnaK